VSFGDWLHLAGLGLTLLTMSGAGLIAYAKLAEKIREFGVRMDKLDARVSAQDARFDEHLQESNDTSRELLVALGRIEERLIGLDKRLTREESRHQ